MPVRFRNRFDNERAHEKKHTYRYYDITMLNPSLGEFMLPGQLKTRQCFSLDNSQSMSNWSCSGIPAAQFLHHNLFAVQSRIMFEVESYSLSVTVVDDHTDKLRMTVRCNL